MARLLTDGKYVYTEELTGFSDKSGSLAEQTSQKGDTASNVNAAWRAAP